ncbi:MAG: class I SAM-dependent methyltransferase [Thermoproteota archaeon]|nr:class I SAM-dependent methyltransferase [Thermoproteota archaeon]
MNKESIRRFTSNYSKGILEKRYVKAALHRLPFDDKSFDLVLSGHFLFTYADKFDFDFHLSSMLELFRVSSKEVCLELVAKKYGCIPYSKA